MLFKVDYFLAAYVAYFVVLNLVSLVVSLLVDRSEWGSKTVDALTVGAFVSEHYRQLATVSEAAKPEDDDLRSLLLWRILAADEQRVVKDRLREAEAGAARAEDSKAGYSREFYRFLLAKRTNIGCRPDLFPRGRNFYFFNVETRGLLEDLLVYLLNYHKILSTMFSIKGSPHYSRLDRRVVFTMQHVVCLSILALVDEIFRAAGLSSARAGLFTLLVIPTLSIALNVLFRAIVMSETMRRRGRPFLLVTFAIGAMCILVFAAMASSTQGRFDLIGAYTLKVFVVSSLQELALILLLFYHRMYFAVYVSRFPVLMVGRYFLERLLLGGERASGGFVCKSYSLLRLVTVEWAYGRTQTLMAAAAQQQQQQHEQQHEQQHNPQRRLEQGDDGGEEEPGVELQHADIYSSDGAGPVELRSSLFETANPLLSEQLLSQHSRPAVPAAPPPQGVVASSAAAILSLFRGGAAVEAPLPAARSKLAARKTPLPSDTFGALAEAPPAEESAEERQRRIRQLAEATKRRVSFVKTVDFWAQHLVNPALAAFAKPNPLARRSRPDAMPSSGGDEGAAAERDAADQGGSTQL